MPPWVRKDAKRCGLRIFCGLIDTLSFLPSSASFGAGSGRIPFFWGKDFSVALLLRNDSTVVFKPLTALNPVLPVLSYGEIGGCGQTQLSGRGKRLRNRRIVTPGMGFWLGV